MRCRENSVPYPWTGSWSGWPLEGEAALRHSHEGPLALRHRWRLGELARPGHLRVGANLRDHTVPANSLVSRIHDCLPSWTPTSSSDGLGWSPTRTTSCGPSTHHDYVAGEHAGNSRRKDDPSFVEAVDLTDGLVL